MIDQGKLIFTNLFLNFPNNLRDLHRSQIHIQPSILQEQFLDLGLLEVYLGDPFLQIHYLIADI